MEGRGSTAAGGRRRTRQALLDEAVRPTTGREAEAARWVAGTGGVGRTSHGRRGRPRRGGRDVTWLAEHGARYGLCPGLPGTSRGTTSCARRPSSAAAPRRTTTRPTTRDCRAEGVGRAAPPRTRGRRPDVAPEPEGPGQLHADEPGHPRRHQAGGVERLVRAHQSARGAAAPGRCARSRVGGSAPVDSSRRKPSGRSLREGPVGAGEVLERAADRIEPLTQVANRCLGDEPDELVATAHALVERVRARRPGRRRPAWSGGRHPRIPGCRAQPGRSRRATSGPVSACGILSGLSTIAIDHSHDGYVS